MAQTSAQLYALAKKVVAYPDHNVPVVSTKDWLKSGPAFAHPGATAARYFKSLLPILGWITRYNSGWLIGDLIAGTTVGVVVVPQAMSYAKIATLPPEYGLYSSFFGVLIYCLFATSKDVSIGPVAVMSLTVAQIIKHIEESHPGQFTAPEVAITLALLCGLVTLSIGLLRLGWIIEFIPVPAVSGFMTGSAITIVSGQIPGLMGITGFDTRTAAYLVMLNSLKGLPRTTIDAAFGLTGLLVLYAIRFACDYLAKRYPQRARLFFFMNVCRHAFVLVVLTLAAWLYCWPRRNEEGEYPIRLLLTVPSGLRHVKPPNLDGSLVRSILPDLPVATIVLILEHIAISKSFGRFNGYTINPNQELIAIGVSNAFGSCLGSYPVTGSFSRSALKSKSGVRTPLAGIFTAAIVIVALYGLTPAFYWIPSAGLSAVIIHAVADLVASPEQIYAFWRISPIEFLIWLGALLITIFSSIEHGIYMSVCASLAFLLLRVALPRGKFLGRVPVQEDDDYEDVEEDVKDNDSVSTSSSSGSAEKPYNNSARDVFVPLKNDDGNILSADIKVLPPEPGVVIYRFEESLLYPNASLTNSALVSYVREHFRRGMDVANVKLQDRPWNDPGPPRGVTFEQLALENEKKDCLKAVVLDFSVISHVDITSVQLLIDTRNDIERWVGHPVEFHFASILSPWIRRALIAGGFGIGKAQPGFHHEVARVVPFRQVAMVNDEIPGENRESTASARPLDDEEKGEHRTSPSSSSSSSAPLPPPSTTSSTSSLSSSHPQRGKKLEIVHSTTPFFHVDLQAAVRAAERNVRRRPKPPRGQ